MLNLLDCEHRQRILVRSSRGMDNDSHVYVCSDCGLIMIWSRKGNVNFNMNFHIHGRDVLDAIAKWTNYVSEEPQP